MRVSVRFAAVAAAIALSTVVIPATAGGLPPPSDVSTPAAGSAQRTAILNAVRGIAVAELGGPVEFVVHTMRVLGEWAFVEVTPQRPGGGEIFYVYTKYQAAWDAGALDPTAVALLRETPAGWLVYEYDFGSTDVPWFPWLDLYPAPVEVFPFNPFGGGK